MSDRQEAERYTDRDVLDNVGLVAIAQSYALGYVGEFEFMRSARHQMQTAGYLTIAVARGVLNCMRVDPDVQHMLPPPAGRGRAHLRVVGDDERVVPFRKPKAPEPERKVAPRYPVHLKARIRKPYVYSSHERAFRAHLVDNDRTTMTYYPAIDEYKIRVYSMCGQNTVDHLRRLADEHELPEDKVLCPRCLNVQLERNGDTV